jgi:hypothetical protein
MGFVNTRISPFPSLAVLGVSLALLATACGTGKSASAEVASLGSTVDSGPSTTAPANTQDALLKYAACMRENGVDMADPTFDADGNPTGGGFGRGSGIDPRSDAFQAAQKVCGDLLQGVALGGRNRPDFTAIQSALTDYTACLRDEGLQVDDVSFGPPGGGAAGAATDGSVPPAGGGGGGFNGPPPGGSAPVNGGPGGPGGAGFNPTDRIIERLGLDKSDPAVAAALDKCQSILTDAFQPPNSSTSPTATTP